MLLLCFSLGRSLSMHGPGLLDEEAHGQAPPMQSHGCNWVNILQRHTGSRFWKGLVTPLNVFLSLAQGGGERGAGEVGRSGGRVGGRGPAPLSTPGVSSGFSECEKGYVSGFRSSHRLGLLGVL
jgi:hypothetical protein